MPYKTKHSSKHTPLPRISTGISTLKYLFPVKKQQQTKHAW